MENGDVADLGFEMRVHELIEVPLRAPFESIGKPKPLKENLSGFWSRRIDDAHRLVYV
jgi:toxin YoeB